MGLLQAEHVGNDRHTLGGLFHDLRQETTTLIRQEIELVRTEMSEKIEKFTHNLVAIVTGAVLAIPALVLVLIGGANGLSAALVRWDVSPAIAAWLPHVIVGFVVLGVAYAFIQKGITAMRREPMIPEQTAATLRENKEWIARKVR